MRCRYRLTVIYDGTAFCGWQKQEPPGLAPLRTVQGILEQAIMRAVRQPVSVVGASRTDSGVHAVGQVACFDAETTIPVERLHLAINRHLPDDVAVADAKVVEPQFDPIADARGKMYRYTIHNSPLRPIFDRHFVWHCWLDLDVERMREAAGLIVGEHDFTSFANAHHGRESTVRTVFSCDVRGQGLGVGGQGSGVEGKAQPLPCLGLNPLTPSPPHIHIDISGSGFLYHMVRIIAGTLVEVGRGHWSPEDIPRILAARNRSAAGPTLPPQGLMLMRVWYE